MSPPDAADASADWSEGYHTETPYALAYFRELNPHVMARAIGGNGFDPPDTAASFTYMELGFGRGLSLLIHAAANPWARFYGVDFMPEHVSEVRGLARVAGVENLDVRQISFAVLEDQDYPAFDVIAMHGVWSWISAENRGHIRNFIARKLKPGGVLYLSYNAMPGWLAMLPLRELMKAEFDRAAGTVEQRIAAAKSYAARLAEAKAGFFASNPKALSFLKLIESESAAYLAHEYFNADWHVFYFRDVLADLSGLGLSYCGSARLANNLDALQIKSEARAVLDAARDLAEREMLKDFVTNRQFRSDIYQQAPRPVDRAAFVDRAGEAVLVPTVTVAEFEQLSLVTAAGKFKVQAPHFRTIMAALGDGPKTVSEIARRLDPVTPAAATVERAYQFAYILAAFGAVAFALPASAQAAAAPACRRFNDAVLGLLPGQYGGRMLASPVTGGGVASSQLDFTLLAAHREGGAAAVDQVFKRRGVSVQAKGQPLTEAEARRHHSQLYDAFVAEKLPIYRALGITD